MNITFADKKLEKLANNFAAAQKNLVMKEQLNTIKDLMIFETQIVLPIWNSCLAIFTL